MTSRSKQHLLQEHKLTLTIEDNQVDDKMISNNKTLQVDSFNKQCEE